jgi:mitochondrial fission protein ELM1
MLMHERLPRHYNTLLTSNHDFRTWTLTAQMEKRMTVWTMAHHFTREFCASAAARGLAIRAIRGSIITATMDLVVETTYG